MSPSSFLVHLRLDGWPPYLPQGPGRDRVSGILGDASSGLRFSCSGSGRSQWLEAARAAVTGIAHGRSWIALSAVRGSRAVQIESKIGLWEVSKAPDLEPEGGWVWPRSSQKSFP